MFAAWGMARLTLQATSALDSTISAHPASTEAVQEELLKAHGVQPVGGAARALQDDFVEDYCLLLWLGVQRLDARNLPRINEAGANVGLRLIV